MESEYIIVTSVILLSVIVIIIYNSLVRKQKLLQEAWSGIDVQLKRRYELIPSLVKIVKGYTEHEKKTLTTVTKMR